MARIGGTPPAQGVKHRVPTRAGGGAWLVKASQESMGGTGSCGHEIRSLGYSELSTVPQGTSSDFKALGNIPCGTILNITNPANGKTVQAAKQDVGAGSPGFLPVMGLYPGTSAALGLSGGEYSVIIERADQGTLSPVRGTPASAGAGTPALNLTPGTGPSVVGGGGGGSPSVLSVLSDLVTGNIGDLAATLAMAAATGIKDLAVGFTDMVIVPVWHRNQQAVWYYTTNVLFPGKASSHKAWKTWPVNAAFWGFGYALLFTDPTSGNLKPVAPRQSRLARHVRAGQAVPARRSLIKPADVKGKTPKKPAEVTSRVGVNHTATLAAHRKRNVKIEKLAGALDRELAGGDSNGGKPRRPTGTRTGPGGPAVYGAAPVREVESVAPKATPPHPSRGLANPDYPGRRRPPSSGGKATKDNAGTGTPTRDRARRRRDA